MLLAGNSNDVVQTMRRADTGAAITDATLTCRITDPHGTEIDSVSVSYQSDDEYRGTTTAEYHVGVLYPFEITSSNYKFRRIVREKAKEPVG